MVTASIAEKIIKPVVINVRFPTSLPAMGVAASAVGVCCGDAEGTVPSSVSPKKPIGEKNIISPVSAHIKTWKKVTPPGYILSRGSMIFQ
ncbi:MAG: hypothetical protein NWE92_07080 [Candidatus Bathyarchaeota archaeon]|nr:hypothetical protein [Candidatus Bathyarchaeota archaeon]